MKRRHYFQVDNNLASRSLARMFGLQESPNGNWYLMESRATAQSLASAKRIFKSVPISETTSASVSTAMNLPTSKSRSRVGTLFGGTFTQNEQKTEFAGQAVGQKPGDQIRGTQRVKSSSKKHPFAGKLVGGEEE